MRRLVCRFFGHEIMVTSNRHRECIRCGQRETLRMIGEVTAWEVVSK